MLQVRESSLSLADSRIDASPTANDRGERSAGVTRKTTRAINDLGHEPEHLQL